MRYALLVYLEDDNFAGQTEADKHKLDHDSAVYDEQLRESGHFIAASALGPRADAVTIRPRNGEITTTDGPFAETKEYLGGLILVEARDLNEAIRIAAGIPVAQYGRIEVRPAWSPQKMAT